MLSVRRVEMVLQSLNALPNDKIHFNFFLCDYLRIFIEEDIWNFNFVAGVVNGCRHAPDFQHAVLHRAWRKTAAHLIRPLVINHPSYSAFPHRLWWGRVTANP